jgi:biotin carboxylase
MKPDRSSGAKGVRILEDSDDLAGCLSETLAFSPTGTAILERFIVGHQGTCEGVIEDGEVVLTFFLDRQTARPPFATTSGHRVPTRLAVDLQRELVCQLGILWSRLGVCRGPFDCDFVATEHEVFLLDVSPRVGGNSIARLIRRAAGFDVIEYAVRHACGDPYPVPRNIDLCPSAMMIFGADRAGILSYDTKQVEMLAAEPWVAYLEFDVSPGATVQPFVNSRHRIGEALVVAKNRTEVDARTAELERRLDLRITPR